MVHSAHFRWSTRVSRVSLIHSHMGPCHDQWPPSRTRCTNPPSYICLVHLTLKRRYVCGSIARNRSPRNLAKTTRSPPHPWTLVAGRKREQTKGRGHLWTPTVCGFNWLRLELKNVSAIQVRSISRSASFCPNGHAYYEQHQPLCL